MKKRIVALSLCVLIVFSALVVPSFAVTPVDPARPSSLTLKYARDGRVFEGVEVRTYRIAEVFADGTYALTGAFAKYPVKIYDVTSQSEWRAIASTLAAYAAADGIEPTRIGTTDKNGEVRFENILPGMYLTLSVTVREDNTVTIFETFLTVVPRPDENGNHNYDVTAVPKSESYTSVDDKEYKVIKLWKDEGASGKRPANIIVDILKDGVIVDTKILSSENSWSYSWTAPDDGSSWYAVERDVAEGYTVTAVREGNTFVVTNKATSDDSGDAPQTGEMINLRLYAVVMCISGGLLVVLAVWRKRNDA